MFVLVLEGGKIGGIGGKFWNWEAKFWDVASCSWSGSVLLLRACSFRPKTV
jgi:hypothetical protein